MSERRARWLIASSLRPLLPLAVLWLAGSTLLLGMVLQQQIPYEELLLDPNAYRHIPWYTGLVSNLGVLGWTVAAVMAACGAWISGRGGRAAAGHYLGGGALFTTLLLLDDLFQLHIVVSRALGQPKSAFYALYLGLGLWWAGANWRELARTRWALLAAAVLALTASVVVDQTVTPSSAELVIEDSCKFLGILAWSLYFALTGRDIAASVVAAATRAAPEDQPIDEPFDDGPATRTAAVLAEASAS